MTDPGGTVSLAGLDISDPPGRWEALGFAVGSDGRLMGPSTPGTLGIAPPGRGIVGWTLAGLAVEGDLDGLPTRSAGGPPQWVTAHRILNPNGAWSLDHLGVVTPPRAPFAAVLDARGLPLRRRAEVRGARMGFRRLGGPILEVVEDPEVAATGFWGVTFAMVEREALDELVATHGVVSAPRPAVQPGRRIATVSREAGLSARVAFIDPEPPRSQGSGAH